MRWSRELGWGGLLICLAASFIAAYQAWLVLGDPIFEGDSGYRVFFAYRPVVKLGNRIWLPFLQLHIWLYHLLGLPVAGVKLITVFYSWAAMTCLGMYWRRILGDGPVPAGLAMIAMFCFAAQQLSVETYSLMQEPIGVALFFAFLFFVSRGPNPSPIALICAAAALMTRDAYWIYLFAATLVGLRGLLRNRRLLLTYASLWAAPILWLAVCVPAIYLVAFGRLPSIPIEWPLMYNPADPIEDPVSSFESLRRGLLSSRVLPLATGSVIAFAALAVWAKRNVVQFLSFSEFSSTLIRAVPLALAITYGLVLLLDPWQVTPGNPRVGWPLLELSFAVAPLLIRAAWSAPAAVRVLVPAAIIAGFALGVHPQPIQGRTESNASAMREQSRLLQGISAARLGESPHICVIAQLSWSVFSELDAPLFHERKTFVSWKRETPNDCDVVIVEEGKGIRPPPGYRPLITIILPERGWSAYARP